MERSVSISYRDSEGGVLVHGRAPYDRLARMLLRRRDTCYEIYKALRFTGYRLINEADRATRDGYREGINIPRTSQFIMYFLVSFCLHGYDRHVLENRRHASVPFHSMIESVGEQFHACDEM